MGLNTPAPPQVRVGRAQEIANGGVMNTFNNFPLFCRLGQSAQRPMRDPLSAQARLRAHRSRRTLGQVLIAW